MTSYPVDVEVTSPTVFERSQLVLRLVLTITLGFVGISAGWLGGLLFFVLPLIAGIAISTTSSARYLAETGPRVWKALAWLTQLSAYMILLVDRFPAQSDHPVHAQIQFTGTPTVKSALVRLVTSIPSAVVLGVLTLVAAILWVIAAISVLFGWAIPGSIHAFQRGIVRWQLRLWAYHASLVEEYPPFSFDSIHEHHDAMPMARAR